MLILWPFLIVVVWVAYITWSVYREARPDNRARNAYIILKLVEDTIAVTPAIDNPLPDPRFEPRLAKDYTRSYLCRLHQILETHSYTDTNEEIRP